jgi:alcohol dehydrogenase (NADP+)
MATECLCLAASDTKCKFEARAFRRRALGPNDVEILMKFCGICHSDLHTAAGHLTGVRTLNSPCVPGHELAGHCVAVGENVTRVKVGDGIGVGCLVDSCGSCPACAAGEEQNCRSSVGTYNAACSERSANAPGEVAHTLGGYTNRFIVNERFAVLVPKNYPLESVGPVMCAGTTLFDPLRRYGAKQGTKVAVVGLGGLGAMGIQVAHAMGCVVTAVTSSASKSDFAKLLGAHAVIVSSNAEQMAACKGTLDLVLNTISAEHDFESYTQLLRPGVGKHVLLGVHAAFAAAMILKSPSSRVVNSMIGGVEASQTVLDLCAKDGIRPSVTVINVDRIAEAYEDLSAGNKTGTRYVLDLSTLDETAAQRLEKVPAPKLLPDKNGMNLIQIGYTIATMWLWGKHL